MRFRIIVIFLLTASCLSAQRNIYIVNKNVKTQGISESFSNSFVSNLERLLAQSGRVQFGGYYSESLKYFQDDLTDDSRNNVEFVNRSIQIKMLKSRAGIQININVISLTTALLEFSITEIFSFQYADDPLYCAHIMADKFLANIKLIAKIIDIADNKYIINAGLDKRIKKGDVFEIFSFNSRGPRQENKTAQLKAYLISDSISYLTLLNSEADLEIGDYAVLKMISDNSDNLDNTDCHDLFVAKILKGDQYFNLRVNSEPQKAEIFINDCKINKKTPAVIERLKKQSITLLLKKRGYKDYVETIDFAMEKWVAKKIVLEPLPAYGRISINSIPPGGEIYIDGKFVNTTPLQDFQIEIADHEIKVKLFGYLYQKRSFFIRTNEHLNFNFKMDEDPNVIENEFCNDANACRLLRNALRFYELKLMGKALKNINMARKYAPKCAALYYWKGLIEWIEYNQIIKAKKSLFYAQRMGLKFDKNTPHPENLTSQGIVKLIKIYKKSRR